MPAREGAFGKLLRWARTLDTERVWAIEDCRHVSGALERFLIARGERVVRVAPKHMAGARRASRDRGKSDSIDAFSVARAALKEGIDELPGAHLDGEALDIRLLVDHREDLDRRPHQRSAAAALASARPLARARDPGRRARYRQMAREGLPPSRPRPQTTRVRIARELVRHITATPSASGNSSQNSPRSSKATRRNCSKNAAAAR